MRPPRGAAPLDMSNWSSKYLPNREELLFRTVMAFPNASNTGFESRTMFFTSFTAASLPPDPLTAAMYDMICFAASVLPVG